MSDAPVEYWHNEHLEQIEEADVASLLVRDASSLTVVGLALEVERVELTPRVVNFLVGHHQGCLELAEAMCSAKETEVKRSYRAAVVLAGEACDSGGGLVPLLDHARCVQLTRRLLEGLELCRHISHVAYVVSRIAEHDVDAVYEGFTRRALDAALDSAKTCSVMAKLLVRLVSGHDNHASMDEDEKLLHEHPLKSTARIQFEMRFLRSFLPVVTAESPALVRRILEALPANDSFWEQCVACAPVLLDTILAVSQPYASRLDAARCLRTLCPMAVVDLGTLAEAYIALGGDMPLTLLRLTLLELLVTVAGTDAPKLRSLPDALWHDLLERILEHNQEASIFDNRAFCLVSRAMRARVAHFTDYIDEIAPRLANNNKPHAVALCAVARLVAQLNHPAFHAPQVLANIRKQAEFRFFQPPAHGNDDVDCSIHLGSKYANALGFGQPLRDDYPIVTQQPFHHLPPPTPDTDDALASFSLSPQSSPQSTALSARLVSEPMFIPRTLRLQAESSGFC